MCNAQNNFNNQLFAELLTYKREIAELRMPFAKQELRGGKQISAEPSISHIDTISKDFIFNIKGDDYSMRSLIAEFEAIFSAIKPEDIN